MASTTVDTAASRARRTTSSPLRVALVGCGAMARENLMPVLAGYDRVTLAALVDRHEPRAAELARAYGVTRVLTDTAAITAADFDGVILATPPAHHAPATLELASRGLHVFVEKPMAVTFADATAMVDAAERAGVTLSVGFYRRFLPSVRLLRDLVARQEFGRVLGVDAEEGGPYGWQLATLDVLTRSAGGGGVLIDLGSHVLDLVLHVLDATPSLTSYRDNSRGGIETDALLHASLRVAGSDVPLRLELSRTRELRGSILVRCEHATLELRRADFTRVLIHRGSAPAAGDVEISATRPGGEEFIGYEAFRLELEDWVSAIARGADPLLSGRSVLPVVDLVERAYAHRAEFEEPGTAPRRPGVGCRAVTPAGRRVLVTGAGGFLGGRVVELLRDTYGCQPVALVREPKGAARLVQQPTDIVLGDVTSRADMDRVLRGCDAVVHCAVGTSWKPDETRRVTVEGTRVTAEAALAAGVRRFVHISSLFVHARDGHATIDESTPLSPPAGDDYGRNKLAAERALESVAQKGLSTVVLRPTRIYGPFSRTFTVRPLQALSEGRLVLTGDANVPGNMVYVDNVVEAIALALDAADVSYAAYLISDPEQGSLYEFYDYFASRAGLMVRTGPALPPASSDAPGWLDGVVSILKSPELRRMVHRVLDTDPVGRLPRRLWDRSPALQQRLLTKFGADAAVIYRPAASAAAEDLPYYGEPATVSVERARRELRYDAPVAREAAMAHTLTWARYARLLPQ